jgi:Family of unknown function (DUF6325)
MRVNRFAGTIARGRMTGRRQPGRCRHRSNIRETTNGVWDVHRTSRVHYRRFPGNQFNGDIAPELGKLVDSGTIRVLDLVFIMKDADGDVDAIELEDRHGVALLEALDGEIGGMISEEDIEYAGDGLEPNSSAALLIWEDLWAKPFIEAMRASGGVLIEGSRIQHDLIELSEAALAAAG